MGCQGSKEHHSPEDIETRNVAVFKAFEAFKAKLSGPTSISKHYEELSKEWADILKMIPRSLSNPKMRVIIFQGKSDTKEQLIQDCFDAIVSTMFFSQHFNQPEGARVVHMNPFMIKGYSSEQTKFECFELLKENEKFDQVIIYQFARNKFEMDQGHNMDCSSMYLDLQFQKYKVNSTPTLIIDDRGKTPQKIDDYVSDIDTMYSAQAGLIANEMARVLKHPDYKKNDLKKIATKKNKTGKFPLADFTKSFEDKIVDVSNKGEVSTKK